MNHPQPYPPPLSPIPEDPLLGNPCDSRDPRSPMNPLAGIRATHRTTYGYREAFPDGDSPPFRITATHPVVPQPIMNYESCIMHCYTFSAKERDSETGLSYFGSRYYSSDLSVWLSVDPMSDKYPSLSPYVYCADNPVKLVDPNGEEIVIFVNKTKYTYNGKDFVDGNGNVANFNKNSFEYRVLSDLNKLYNSKSGMIRSKLTDMMKSKHQHSIVNRTTSDGVGFNHALKPTLAEKYGEGSDTETGYNPFATESACADGGYVSCATLAHELLGHGWNNDQGLHEADDHRTENGIRFEEINAINVQNKVLVEHHQKPRSLVGKPGEAKQIPVHLINHYYTTKPK
ncbi:MAG: RHS repeat-associated core domain-containing protein [Bacteroidales bacterium]|nr:RHS repeat-associated core domain-containing protein [Bacteroidales bacterium]